MINPWKALLDKSTIWTLVVALVTLELDGDGNSPSRRL
uniref:Uncharacterized protein n=1 Tax=Rhizophora mucronata TaxID=61149 RepID=A0A2P2P8R2_RHIMU